MTALDRIATNEPVALKVSSDDWVLVRRSLIGAASHIIRQSSFATGATARQMQAAAMQPAHDSAAEQSWRDALTSNRERDEA